VAKGELARASAHRFLQQHQLSRQTFADANTIERRAFVAEHTNDIWHADVMHGPTVPSLRSRKVYLVSFLDDASRLIAHADFCWGETALDIEGVLQSAILKRGIPKKIILDNGAAYRATSLQEICARLEIRLVYCPPYEPQGKGKL
jgi:putative transposase